MQRSAKVLMFVLAAGWLLVQTQQVNAQEAGRRLRRARQSGLDGSQVGSPTLPGTGSAWRYSALNQINTSNVKKLAPAWMFQTGDYQDGLQSTPIVVGGVDIPLSF